MLGIRREILTQPLLLGRSGGTAAWNLTGGAVVVEGDDVPRTQVVAVVAGLRRPGDGRRSTRSSHRARPPCSRGCRAPAGCAPCGAPKARRSSSGTPRECRRHLVDVAVDRDRPRVLVGEQSWSPRRSRRCCSRRCRRPTATEPGRTSRSWSPPSPRDTGRRRLPSAVRAGAAVLARGGEALVDVDARGVAGAGVAGGTGTA